MLHLLTVYFIKMVKWPTCHVTQAQLLGAITHITLLHITCFLALDDRSKSKWPVKTEQRDRSGIFFDRWKYFNIGYCLQNLTWWNSSLKNYFEEKKNRLSFEVNSYRYIEVFSCFKYNLTYFWEILYFVTVLGF